MKYPPEEYKVSECCLSSINDKGECMLCGFPCSEIIIEDDFFDEVRADDERHEEKQNQETE